jgi:hypothetical protein
LKYITGDLLDGVTVTLPGGIALKFALNLSFVVYRRERRRRQGMPQARRPK